MELRELQRREVIAQVTAETDQVINSAQVVYAKSFNLKLHGNEVYYTASSLSVLVEHSCIGLH
jgi:hypothetical protein